MGWLVMTHEPMVASCLHVRMKIFHIFIDIFLIYLISIMFDMISIMIDISLIYQF